MSFEHRQEECKNPDCNGCMLCHLSVCKVCGLFEGALTTHCPGVESYAEWAEKSYRQGWDFIDGKWVKDGSDCFTREVKLIR